MRNLIILLLLGIAINSNAQFYYYPFPPSKNDLKVIENAGVKICNEYIVDSEGKNLLSVLEFGAMGLPAVLFEKGTDMNGDSINITEITYKYDQLQRLQSSSMTDFEEGQNSITGYSYDSKGRLIKKVIASIDPLTYKYSYDAAGRITQSFVTVRIPALDKDGEPTGKTIDKPLDKYTYKYDQKNRLVEEAHYFWEDDKLSELASYKNKWEYNTNNQIMSVILIDIDDAIISTDKLSYNEKGLLIKKIRENIDGEEIQFMYEYCTNCKQSWMQ